MPTPAQSVNKNAKRGIHEAFAQQNSSESEIKFKKHFSKEILQKFSDDEEEKQQKIS